MQLNARFTGSGAEAGLVMNCNDTFVSVPVGLAVFSTNPAACPAGDASCGAFTSAGTAFPLQVKAACWTADGDTDLADNPATPNFRLNRFGLGHTLVAPAAGQSGTAGGASVNIGRFTPHHFALTGGTLTNRSDIGACADTFTYMDGPFRLDYTLRAENVSNGLTQNYTGAFAKLDLTSAPAVGYGAVSGTTNLTAQLTAAGAASGSWLNGAGIVAAPFTVSRAVNPDGPFATVNVGVAPSDVGAVPSAATTANKAYLRGNWGTATFDQDPTASARFGVYRSSDGFIYFRENY
jgi:MSHA biogenesis protein MshQ